MQNMRLRLPAMLNPGSGIQIPLPFFTLVSPISLQTAVLFHFAFNFHHQCYLFQRECCLRKDIHR